MKLEKCDICGLEVKPDESYFAGTKRWFINASIVGEPITLEGHKHCMEQVNNLVVIPNRIKLHQMR